MKASDLYDDFNDFDLINESDRGCVLVGAAILEEHLERIFLAVFKRNKISKKVERSIFDSNGALSNFSSKIKLAYSLGFINELVYQDLESVRKIRNQFAHSSEHVDFCSHSSTKLIKDMNCNQDPPTIKRYSYVGPKLDTNIPQEVVLRNAGYVKYAKSLFCIGIKKLEFELIKAAFLIKTNAL